MIPSLEDFRFFINILYFNLIWRFLSCVIIKYFLKNNKIYKLNIKYNINFEFKIYVYENLYENRKLIILFLKQALILFKFGIKKTYRFI